jgi:hypothetical protein
MAGLLGTAAVVTQVDGFNQTQALALLGNRNLLINSRGAVNQREYVSGTATTGGDEYTVDRWRVVTLGQNLAWTETEGTKTFTAPAGGVEQEIEGLNIHSGTFIIGWTGAATCTVDGVAKSSGDTFTLTGGTNCTVKFSGGTFSLPQIEAGSTATPFEHESYGVTKAKCKGYFERLSYEALRTICAGAYYSTTNAYGVLRFSEKRSSPACTISAVDAVKVYSNTTSRTSTAINFADISLNSARINPTTSAATAGHAAWFEFIASGDYIDINSEL